MFQLVIYKNISENLFSQALHIMVCSVNQYPPRSVFMGSDLPPEVHLHAVFPVLVVAGSSAREEVRRSHSGLKFFNLNQIIHANKASNEIFILMNSSLLN